ncbi:MAG TPA: hypothetical protein PK016_06760 [Candidatus Atribacteria bacterium]|nr:hypothetical protein [Candidatus Atribacteria bacterium]
MVRVKNNQIALSNYRNILIISLSGKTSSSGGKKEKDPAGKD